MCKTTWDTCTHLGSLGSKGYCLILFWFGLFSALGRLVWPLDYYDEMFYFFSTAINFGYGNDFGRQGIHAFFRSVCDVCRENMARSSRISSLLPRVFIQAGSSRGCAYTSKYAYRPVTYYTDPIESADQLRERNMWSVFDPSDDVEPFRFSYKVPDVALALFDVKDENEDRIYRNKRLVVGEVKSDAEMYEGKWEAGVCQAMIQTMKELAYRDHSAAIVVSPLSAAIMLFDKQDGFIKCKRKDYILGNGCDRMNAEEYEEFFRDVVAYFWDTYYACL